MDFFPEPEENPLDKVRDFPILMIHRRVPQLCGTGVSPNRSAKPGLPPLC